MSGYPSVKLRSHEGLEEGRHTFGIHVWPVERTSHAKQALQLLWGGVNSLSGVAARLRLEEVILLWSEWFACLGMEAVGWVFLWCHTICKCEGGTSNLLTLSIALIPLPL